MSSESIENRLSAVREAIARKEKEAAGAAVSVFDADVSSNSGIEPGTELHDENPAAGHVQAGQDFMSEARRYFAGRQGHPSKFFEKIDEADHDEPQREQEKSIEFQFSMKRFACVGIVVAVIVIAIYAISGAHAGKVKNGPDSFSGNSGSKSARTLPPPPSQVAIEPTSPDKKNTSAFALPAPRSSSNEAAPAVQNAVPAKGAIEAKADTTEATHTPIYKKKSGRVVIQAVIPANKAAEIKRARSKEPAVQDAGEANRVSPPLGAEVESADDVIAKLKKARELN